MTVHTCIWDRYGYTGTLVRDIVRYGGTRWYGLQVQGGTAYRYEVVRPTGTRWYGLEVRGGTAYRYEVVKETKRCQLRLEMATTMVGGDHHEKIKLAIKSSKQTKKK